MHYEKYTQKGVDNAEFILLYIAEGKIGETVAIIADEFTYAAAELLCVCARRLGLKPFIIDLSVYGIRNFNRTDYPFIEPVRSAINASNISISLTYWYFSLLGSQAESDAIHDGKRRFFYLITNGIEEWEFERDEILAARKRVPALKKLVQHAHEMHITTPLGTDLICQIGDENILSAAEVLYIIPMYAEVALVPKYGTVTGTAVIDANKGGYGHSHYDIPPMKLIIDNGKLVDYSVPPSQRDDFEKFIFQSNPKADMVDELGLVTIAADVRNKYSWTIWGGEGHQANSFHIALGNNQGNRKDMIHGSAHRDFNMLDPTIEIDGKVIYKEKTFYDNIIYSYDT